jgi:nucleoside phosphorylase
MSGREPRSADVLLVAAHVPDLAGMRLYLGDELRGVIGHLRVHAKAVGLGMPVAAAAVARAILAVQPRVVVLIGTVGVYPGLSYYRPRDVVIATRVQYLDHAVLAGRSAFPEPMQIAYDLQPVMCAALRVCHPRAFLAPIASPVSQTVDDALAARVHGATGCEGENSEAVAVAAAARAAAVPCLAVLGVSHVVGSTARHDWAQFRRDAVGQAAQTVATWLQHGAQGLPHE